MIESQHVTTRNAARSCDLSGVIAVRWKALADSNR
jgi:hypothetical protein